MPTHYDAKKKFREAGFTERDIPGTEPVLPEKISRTSNKDLGDIMTKYGAWREYTEQLLTQASTKAAVLREEWQYEFDKKYNGSSLGTATERKKEVGADQELFVRKREVLSAELYRDMLSSRAETYTECIAVLSREITRRGFTIEQQ